MPFKNSTSKESGQAIFYNSIFAKELAEPLFNYRIYQISKLHFSRRSGLFSIDNLLDVLPAFNLKNQSRQYRHKLKTILSQSSLFKLTTDGRFIFKAIPNYDKHKLPVTQSDLSGNRYFMDGVIGSCLINGGLFCSYSRIAASLAITTRRTQQAAARLVESKRIHKTFNYVIPDLPFQKSLQSINTARRDLFHCHGIITPQPVYYKRQRLLGLYLPSTFRIVAKRQSDNLFSQQLPRKVKTQNSKYSLLAAASHYNLFQFTSNHYNYQQYLNDYGFRSL